MFFCLIYKDTYRYNNYGIIITTSLRRPLLCVCHKHCDMLPRDDETTLVLEHTVEKAKKKHHWEKHPPAEACFHRQKHHRQKHHRQKRPPPQLLRLAPKMCVLLYFAGLVHPFFFQLDPSVPHAYMMTQYLMYTGSLSICATCWLL